jgi:uncharacterized protein YbaR (Trm112 family)/SAM-dependent methyltransferase
MRADLVDLLCCPETREPLELRHAGAVFELEGRRHVVDGVLGLRGGGEERLFPILDEIPRLLPRSRLLPEEQEALAAIAAKGDKSGEPQRVEPQVVTPGEVEAEIRRRMERVYRLDATTPDPAARARCEGEIRYMTAEYGGRNKRKYVDLLAPRVAAAESLLEVGGNFPGLTRNLAEFYRPSRAVVANLQILFPLAFKTAERSIDAVRADVQMLPFRDASFALVASAFMLEHVPDWRAGLASMARVGERVFVAFGPNKLFPFEVGHLDAPLAGTLPRPLAAYAAWAWKAATGDYRTLRRVREIQSEVFHVASPTFRHEGRRLGLRVTNLFPALVETILRDPDAPRTRARRALQSAPLLARWTARGLTAIGMEPQIYCLLER